MGHYTGVATRLRVKKTAPKHVMDFLDFIYQIPGATAEQPPPKNPEQKKLNEAVGTVSGMLTHGSAYFDTWQWRVKEDCGDFWLYESRASSKDVIEQLFVMLLSGISENLMLEEGDILLRSIYEEGSTEVIVYFLNNTIQEGRGFVYKTDHNFVCDSRHPCKHERDKSEVPWDSEVRHSDDDFDLPWKFEELQALIAKEKKERDANWHPWN